MAQGKWKIKAKHDVPGLSIPVTFTYSGVVTTINVTDTETTFDTDIKTNYGEGIKLHNMEVESQTVLSGDVEYRVTDVTYGNVAAYTGRTRIDYTGDYFEVDFAQDYQWTMTPYRNISGDAFTFAFSVESNVEWRAEIATNINNEGENEWVTLSETGHTGEPYSGQVTVSLTENMNAARIFTVRFVREDTGAGYEYMFEQDSKEGSGAPFFTASVVPKTGFDDGGVWQSRVPNKPAGLIWEQGYYTVPASGTTIYLNVSSNTDWHAWVSGDTVWQQWKNDHSTNVDGAHFHFSPESGSGNTDKIIAVTIEPNETTAKKPYFIKFELPITWLGGTNIAQYEKHENPFITVNNANLTTSGLKVQTHLTCNGSWHVESSPSWCYLGRTYTVNGIVRSERLEYQGGEGNGTVLWMADLVRSGKTLEATQQNALGSYEYTTLSENGLSRVGTVVLATDAEPVAKVTVKISEYLGWNYLYFQNIPNASIYLHSGYVNYPVYTTGPDGSVNCGPFRYDTFYYEIVKEGYFTLYGGPLHTGDYHTPRMVEDNGVHPLTLKYFASTDKNYRNDLGAAPTLAANGEVFYCTIITPVNWTLTADDSWLTSDEYNHNGLVESDGTPHGRTVIITAAKNTTGASRTGSVTIRNDQNTIVVPVTQEG